jgi:betaine-homocysteine S-methyltransferase
MKKGLLERLQNDVILGAEGYIFELERRGYVKAGPYVPEVVLDHPEALKELHREFLHAGAEVMVALTYYAHRDKVKVVGREDELEILNRQAVKLAKEVASEGDSLVAGNICNTWVYDPNNKESSSKAVKNMYREQLQWAVEEGIDLVIGETIEYMGEALLALEVIKEFNLPAVITLAPTAEKSRDGYDWIEVCKELEKNGVDVVGFNCIQGPVPMMDLIKRLRDSVSCYIAAQPVPYNTSHTEPHFQYFKDKKTGEKVPTFELEPFLVGRSVMADFAKEAKEIGVNYIGICCGGSPHYVRAMAEALGRKPVSSRYSPDISKHAQMGNKDFVKGHVKDFVENK